MPLVAFTLHTSLQHFRIQFLQGPDTLANSQVVCACATSLAGSGSEARDNNMQVAHLIANLDERLLRNLTRILLA